MRKPDFLAVPLVLLGAASAVLALTGCRPIRV